MTSLSTLSGMGALVTGGSRGIGRAIVERLAADGADVVFSYHTSTEAAERVAAETGALAVRADQGSEEDLARLFAMAEKRLPGVDIVVNNAAEGGQAPIADVTRETYERVFAVNARATFLAIQWAGRVMRDGGRIVNISTLNTALPAPGIALYAASKAAAEQFAKVAARELGERGITVNIVSPGATDTEMLRASNPPEALEQASGCTALRRLGRPDDIAAVVAFLAGPDGRWITGQNLLATGGMLL
ncbi:SDR family oxidoreductase [Nonomuraea cavernae]|uniref:3-oxoacyl-ACP reductase n=1 Tax=Nonomuraea cavernae TaxID=2045107 RepID=A0A918DQI1_9ACTN|nr:SDR family oxidoreductase [Nonomuraea cavernae]MCA2190185.1 SDR family oxidoreductase [Nonomuraea cavernae]GGO78691.1 3-oxoacyl-ACP reductase [Nonomuraea cavernae]